MEQYTDGEMMAAMRNCIAGLIDVIDSAEADGIVGSVTQQYATAHELLAYERTDDVPVQATQDYTRTMQDVRVAR